MKMKTYSRRRTEPSGTGNPMITGWYLMSSWIPAAHRLRRVACQQSRVTGCKHSAIFSTDARCWLWLLSVAKSALPMTP